MNECTGDWNTTARLDKSPNAAHLTGVVTVNDHTVTNITGEFKPQGGQPAQLANGKCHPLPNQRRALSFQVVVNGETLAFRGIIDTVNSPDTVLCGTFVIVDGPPDPGDTGTWEATKGGAGPSGGKGKGSRKGGTYSEAGE